MKPVGKGGRPAYRRIQAEICGRIATGQLKPGDRVESERELAAIHNVSLMTARQSLSELAKSGLVSRSQGRGTFVASGLAESTPLPGDYGMVYLGACLIAAVRVAHQQPTNFHVRAANLPIEESLELAHKIYNCVSERRPSSEQPRRNSIGKQRGPAKLR
jgi:DNA-binding transcriptional MocR family regulator